MFIQPVDDPVNGVQISKQFLLKPGSHAVAIEQRQAGLVDETADILDGVERRWMLLYGQPPFLRNAEICGQ